MSTSANSKLLGVSSLVADEFNVDELNPEVLYAYIDEAHREDPIIKVLNYDVYLGGDRCSRICMIDPDTNTIHLGMSDMKDMPYKLHEDWKGVDNIFYYCYKNDFKYGDAPFPDVPVAESPFPSNQLYRPYSGYPIERQMAMNGFRLLDVSAGCAQEMSDLYPIFTSENNIAGFESYSENDGFYFSPFSDGGKENVVSMQFNPMHPMAVHMLRSIEWNGLIAHGYYSYRERSIPFEYNLEDRRYRIYSEDWRQMLSERIGYLEVFDLVASFDFAPMLNLKDRKRFIEPYVIEPLIIKMKEENPYPYAKIGPYLDTVSRGVGVELCVPYSRFSFEQTGGKRYREITSDAIYYTDDTLEYNGRIYNIFGSVIQDNDIFLRKIVRDEKVFFRAYIQDDDVEDSECEFFHLAEGQHFLTFPCNLKGSIIYPYNVVTIIDAKKCGNTVHEYLPMFVSMDEERIFTMDNDVVVPRQEVLKIDLDELEKMYVCMDYKGDTHTLKQHICYICQETIRDPVPITEGDVVRWFHEKCMVCFCGNSVAVYFCKKRKRFLCKSSYSCSYQRGCYICDKVVLKEREIKGSLYYVHHACVKCTCGYYKNLKYDLNLVMCMCVCNKGVKKKQVPMILPPKRLGKT